MVQMTNFVALRNGGGVDPRDKRAKKRVGFSDVGNRGSYTPGGDSFKNYSQKDQETMFKAAGGKDKFIERAADIEQRFKRSADTQGFLDRVNLFDKFKNRGDEIVRDEAGRQILSMQDPRLTAQAPTFSQLIGDIGRGIGSIAQGFAEKGPPIMQLFRSFLPQEGVPSFTNPNDIIGLVNALPEAQRVKYYQLLSQGTPYQKAYEMASGLPFTKFQQMSMGGIATLQ